MMAVTTLQEWLTDRIAEVLSIDSSRIISDERLAVYGFDSLAASKIIAELSRLLERELPSTLFWDYPTINEVAQVLTEPQQGPRRPAAVARRSSVSCEPVAIVGLSCRFPKAPNLAAFWRLLVDGTDAIADVPPERWDADRLFSPDITAPGKINNKYGGFLTQIDRFEPLFFGISPREAVQMDPQQRIMLELSWEALEDAGVPLYSLRDSRTGVFLGAMGSDYTRIQSQYQAPSTQHTATGQDLSILSARISYTLGLRGPSLTVNTACSSALVAVHLARQSLQTGECSLAVAGGISLILSPESSIAMTKFGGLAPDGRCKSFAASANGYVRSEGGGVVILKTLARALADGDRIYAVIRGSAVNNDGYSNGLTAPSGQAQEIMLREAYANAGVDPREVQFVEAHGTGTLLGDPIEANALGSVFSADRDPACPLLVGSVKSNIGHLEPAAGIAGLIKTTLALQQRLIPPNLHFTLPNPHIDFERLRLRVPTTPTPWPWSGGRSLAGVSAFGFGGTNCHVVLERQPLDESFLLPLASDTEDGLRQLAGRLKTVLLAEPGGAAIRELAGLWPWSCQGTHRLALAGQSKADLLSALDSFLMGRPGAGVWLGVVKKKPRGPVFVFSGTGSQWQQMGRALVQKPLLRSVMTRCDQAFRPYLDESLVDTLLQDDPAWQDDTARVQPAIFMVQVALTAYLAELGIEPAAVLGQSTGELTAAFAAGCLTLEEAARIVCIRSRILKSISGQGAMAVVELAQAAAEELIHGHAAALAIAGTLSPQMTVITGTAAAVRRLRSQFCGQGIGCRQVQIAYASHGPQVEPLVEQLRHALGRVQARMGTRPLFLASKGGRQSEELLDAEHFTRSERQPMQFAASVEQLIRNGHELFLEVSPHPLVTRAIQQCLHLAARSGTAVPVMRRQEPVDPGLRDALGTLFTQGNPIAWSKYGSAARPQADLVDKLGLGDRTPLPRDEETPREQILPISAHSPAALTAQAHQLASFLRSREEVPIQDVVYTASERRSHQDYRLAIAGATRMELITRLDSVGRGGNSEPALARVARARRPAVVFVFPGQGTQWAGMAHDLFIQEPVVREKLQECAQLIASYAGWSLIDELAKPPAESRLEETLVAQPALFSVEVALAEVLRDWGLVPAGVIGHSVGEVAAAHLAGALDLSEAIRLVCLRARVMQRAGGGRMLAVALSAAAAIQEIQGQEDLIGVAAVNAPHSCVLAGDPEALARIQVRLKERAVHCRDLRVNYAFHSPQMEPLRQEFAFALGQVQIKPRALPMFSTVLGAETGTSLLDAEYWGKNLRQTVRFSSAVAAAAERFGASVRFVEVGPHPALSGNIEECLSLKHRTSFPTLWRQRPGRRCLLETAAALYSEGYALRWDRMIPYAGQVVSLPPYPWQRERYWLERSYHEEKSALAEGKPAADRAMQAPLHADTLLASAAPVLKLEWGLVPTQRACASVSDKSFLLLSNRSGIAAQLAAKLQARGARVQLLASSEQSDCETFTRLLTATPFSALVQLSSLDCPAGDATTHEALELAGHRDGGSVFALTRAVSQLALSAPPRLLIVTRGLHSVGAPRSPITLAASLMWGFGRTIAYEHPELGCTRIDLSSAPSDRELDALVDILLTGTKFDEIALRDSECLAAQLVPTPLPPPTVAEGARPLDSLFKEDATYLITGGLGSLGLTLAHWMVDRGARHLALLGRQGASTPRQQSAVARLRSLGATVVVADVDVESFSGLKELVEQRIADMPVLRGVVHAAGSLDGGLLSTQDAGQLVRLMGAKVHGAWNLHLLTRGVSLDFFVLYSSSAALLGSPGLGSYAAANSFLDALAHYRKDAGLPALSINWGPFSDVGLIAERQLVDWLAARGMNSISPAEGCEALGRLIGTREAQVGYIPFDLRKCCDYYPQFAGSFLYSQLARTGAPLAADAGRGRVELSEKLKQLSAADRRVALADEVTALVQHVLQIPIHVPAALDPQTALGGYGMDSLMLLELRHLTRTRLGIELPLALLLVLKEVSISELTSCLADQLETGGGASAEREWEDELL